MKKSNFKTCFISAPVGVDTSVVRRALEKRGIGWLDQTTVESGTSWLEAVDSALEKANFVCAIIPEGQHANIFFELGIAYAKRKPILAFIGSSASLPVDFLSVTYVRTNPTDSKTVQSALETFVTHASKRPRRTPKTRLKSRPNRKESTSFPELFGRQLEQLTASLLQDAGFIVSSSSESQDRGADLAVWIDELQSSLGNPLLVQVKAGDLNAARIQQASAQLRTYVSKTHGRSALLVYWDERNREFPEISQGWPLVLQMSGAALKRLVYERRLSEELLRLRNAAVHGEV